LSKAPDHVVAKIRDRQRIATEEVERLSAKLASLAGA
jgi:valyl-tRNA synthetase